MSKVIIKVNQTVKLVNIQKLGVVKKCFPKQGEVLVEWVQGELTIEKIGDLLVEEC